MELTVNFLLEVFGPDYYRDVLNAIYDLQPHYADGSPVYDGYLNRELYRIFLQLSLLRLPMAGESPKENLDSGWKQTAYPTDMEMVAEYLNDTQKNMADKRSLFRLLSLKYLSLPTGEVFDCSRNNCISVRYNWEYRDIAHRNRWSVLCPQCSVSARLM